MARLQGDQNPQAPQYRPEVPPAVQHPPLNVSPADYPPQSPENPTEFSYPPGAAVAQPQPQHRAVPFPPNGPPCQPENPPPANNPPQYSLNPTHFSYQQPGAAVTYPPQIPQSSVPFPPNAPHYNGHQTTVVVKPQPVNYPMGDGQPYQRRQYDPAVFGGYGAHMGSVPWTTGLFDCMDDPNNALITAFFPCVTFGQVAEILDNGTQCLTSGLMYGVLAGMGLPCILSCTYRSKLRAKYNLLESPSPDLLTHVLCELCSLCQEYRELKNRGLHPGIGWQANMMLQGCSKLKLT